MVSAGHPLAAQAGLSILEAGGNAIDAGVAAGFALNVVQPDMANLGGVAPILLYLSEGAKVASFAGVGRWPRRAQREAVAAAGNGRIPVGPGRWLVPAAVDSWLGALQAYGTMSAAEVMAPAIELAAHGFPANYFLSHNLATAAPNWHAFVDNQAIFLPSGQPPRPGEVVRQSALADTLKSLLAAEARASGAREAGIQATRDAFYRGDIAQAVDAFSRDVGGFLRADDMATFSVRQEPPVSVGYRGRKLYGCGPWSQGPALLQMVKMLERFDVAALGEAASAHLQIEIVKLAMADRNRFYGDPDFVDVPIEQLLSDRHAAERANLIDKGRAHDVDDAAPVTGVASFDTTYVSVVDAAGNGFSATPSDSTMLVTPMVPGLGFAISDRGLQASLEADDPNAIAPGKRARLTPNPALLVDEDGIMVFGTPGGEVQTQAMLQFLVNHLERGMDLQQAVEAPRWASFGVPATEDPHMMTPRLVRLEEPLFDRIGSDLAALGHDAQPWPERAALAGGVCAVRRRAADAVLCGAADPRRMSYVAGR